MAAADDSLARPAVWYAGGVVRYSIDASPSFRHALIGDATLRGPVTIVAADGLSVRVEEAQHQGVVNTAKFSPDERWLGWQSDPSQPPMLLRLTSVDSVPTPVTVPAEVFNGREKVTLVGFTSTDRMILLSGNGTSGNLYTLGTDGTNPTRLNVVSNQGEFGNTVLSSPKGLLVVGSGVGAVTSIIKEDGTLVHQFPGASPLGLSPDGTFLLLLTEAHESNTINEQVCNMATYQCQDVPLADGPPREGAEWLPNGDLVGMVGGQPDVRKVHWWNPRTGQQEPMPKVFSTFNGTSGTFNNILPTPLMSAVESALAGPTGD